MRRDLCFTSNEFLVHTEGRDLGVMSTFAFGSVKNMNSMCCELVDSSRMLEYGGVVRLATSPEYRSEYDCDSHLCYTQCLESSPGKQARTTCRR